MPKPGQDSRSAIGRKVTVTESGRRARADKRVLALPAESARVIKLL
jgi:hypothetical protein